jgi:hypothetical protein
MPMNLLTDDRHNRNCKHLSNLPPIVSDWQQSCQQPQCPHYCQGECCNTDRQAAFAPCPFDGKELPLEDADTAIVVPSEPAP